MKHYCYKIINKLNQHYYIGRRSYAGEMIEEDTYFGSGKRLKDAIKKYGIENFEKIILEEFNDLEALIEAEKALITEKEVKDPNCYNIACGGHGGYTFYENRIYTHTEERKNKISIANKGRKRPDVSERFKNGLNQYWKGKTRSNEDRAKKSAAAKQNILLGKHAGTIMLTCPHCGKTTNTGNAKRWHFDNCKAKA